MQEVWKLLQGKGTDADDKTNLPNLKWFICALEGLSTLKIIKKKTEFSSKAFRDEFNNFFADEEGVKAMFKWFKYIIQNKISNALYKHTRSRS